jgi:hypothetical protein
MPRKRNGATKSQLRQLCAAAYQVVGAAWGPLDMLDNLSAAANGESLPHSVDDGLPWVPPQPVPVSTWQPIETAPKDGTCILAVFPSKSLRIAWYARGRWTDDNLHGLIDPEYWQPLPELPTTEPS